MIKKIMCLLSACFCGFLLFSCGNISVSQNQNTSNEETSITLACWNAQTFFDAQCDGTEYSEFQSLARWSKEKYMVRLERLCQVMTTLNPQIMVLEEIENTGVIQDISNQLAGNSWDSSKNWKYACFAREKEGAIGCAVFSKLPLREFKVHSLFVSSLKAEQPSSRPIMEVRVEAGGKEMVLFVNHWKSKSGGEAQSEIWRDWQENLLGQVVQKTLNSESGITCVMCGDFNRDAREFVCRFGKGRENVLLRWGEAGGGGKILPVACPWFTEGGNFILDTGSYYYKKSWERIDNIMLAGRGKIGSFSPRAQAPWAGSNSIPEAYVLYSGAGYSDHLPLMCRIMLE